MVKCTTPFIVLEGLMCMRIYTALLQGKLQSC